jgi:serine/threonine protein kinase
MCGAHSSLVRYLLFLLLFYFILKIMSVIGPYSRLINQPSNANGMRLSCSYSFFPSLLCLPPSLSRLSGRNIRQLSQNILGTEPVINSNSISPALKDLVRELLTKNCHARPGINAVLSRPVVRDRISSFLNETKKSTEFSHTGRCCRIFVFYLDCVLRSY